MEKRRQLRPEGLDIGCINSDPWRCVRILYIGTRMAQLGAPARLNRNPEIGVAGAFENPIRINGSSRAYSCPRYVRALAVRPYASLRLPGKLSWRAPIGVPVSYFWLPPSAPVAFPRLFR